MLLLLNEGEVKEEIEFARWWLRSEARQVDPLSILALRAERRAKQAQVERGPADPSPAFQQERHVPDR